MTPQWWRCSITFMGAGTSRDDAIDRMRQLFGDLPLMDLKFSASPMGSAESLRALDRQEAKRQIESDTDTGATLNEMMNEPYLAPAPEEDQMMLGGMIPTPRVVHPWQQGSFIFPDDHPLAPYERLAFEQQDTQALNKLQELMPSDRSLPRHVGSVEEDREEDVERDT